MKPPGARPHWLRTRNRDAPLAAIAYAQFAPVELARDFKRG
jgi:hypothetical protein